MDDFNKIKPMQPISGVSPGSRVDYALRYARAGFRVLPLQWLENGACACGDGECRSPGKHPIVDRQHNLTGGVHSATDDAGLIRQIFGRYAQANIGLAIPDGMIAIDVDPRNGGDFTIETLQNQFGVLPDTSMQLTGGGGQHYLYRIPTGLKVAGKLGLGVDVKAAGGYIVAEPSEHISGTAYVWEASSDPLDGVLPVAAPAWVMNKLAATDAAVSRSDQGLRYGVDEKVVAELRGALHHLTASCREMADDRDMWVRVGLACKSIGEAGYCLWEEWSMTSDKFDARDQWKKWQTFNPQAISYRTIFALAQTEGWRNPMAKSDAGMAASGETVAPEQRRGFKFNDVAKLVKDIKPIQWLIEDYVEEGSLVMVYGPPANGKSFLTVDFAASIAYGQEWNGKPVKQGPVFYIAGEGLEGLKRRFKAWQLARGLDELPDGCMYQSEGAAQLLTEQSAQDVSLAIDALVADGGQPPALIVLDTVARNFGPGDENSTMDMSKFIAAIDTYLIRPWRCSVILVHHSGHNMERARGSSALKAAVDAEFEVVKDDTGLVRVRGTKMKDAELPPEMAMKFKSVDLGEIEGQAITSAVLEVADQGVTAVLYRDGATVINAADILKIIVRGWVPVKEIGDTLGVSSATVTRVMKKCSELGYVEKMGAKEGYRVTLIGQGVLSQTGAFLAGVLPKPSPKPAPKSARPWMDTDDKDAD